MIFASLFQSVGSGNSDWQAQDCWNVPVVCQGGKKIAYRRRFGRLEIRNVHFRCRADSVEFTKSVFSPCAAGSASHAVSFAAGWLFISFVLVFGVADSHGIVELLVSWWFS